MMTIAKPVAKAVFVGAGCLLGLILPQAVAPQIDTKEVRSAPAPRPGQDRDPIRRALEELRQVGPFATLAAMDLARARTKEALPLLAGFALATVEPDIQARQMGSVAVEALAEFGDAAACRILEQVALDVRCKGKQIQAVAMLHRLGAVSARPTIQKALQIARQAGIPYLETVAERALADLQTRERAGASHA